MKHRTTSLALAALIFSSTLHAAPPLINYQGRIVVGTTNFEGTGQFKFALVDGGVNQNVTATATALVMPIGGTIGFISVSNNGSGYVTTPAVTITDATGTGATAVATVTGGAVTSIEVTNGGSGYSFQPTITIAPPPPNILTTAFWNNAGTVVGIAPATEPATAVSLPVTKGLYSVLLGDTNLTGMAAFPTGVFVRPDLRLRVWFSDGVNGSQLLSPDQRLAPAAYLADGSVHSAIIADGAITTAKVAPGFTLAGNQITPGTLDFSRLTVPAPPGAGQVLGYNGSSLNWVAAGGGSSVWTLGGLGGTTAFYNGGRVGIGTSSPAHQLGISGGPGWTSNAWTGALALPNASAIGWAANASGQSFGMGHTNTGFAVFRTASAPGTGGSASLYDMFISDAGNVGIGTGITPPLSRLAVGGSNTQVGLSVSAEWVPNQIANVELTGGRPTLQWSANSGSPFTTSTRSWIGHVGSSRGLEFWTRNQTTIFPASDTGWVSRVTLTTDGDINYVGKLGKLDTTEQFTAAVRAADFYFGYSTRRGTPGRALVDDKGPNNPAGPRILAVNYASDWDETHIGGAVTQVKTLRITGGADLAEPFQMKEEELEKGTVVVIDDEHPGRLKRSTGAYDTRVAGIISGANGVNPGIALHQEGVIEGGQNVALSGRVYVHAEATGAPIKPGDLLTTSDTPGHAMKVTDHAKSQGAILGKAMSSLSEGTGMVLVLVTLQ